MTFEEIAPSWKEVLKACGITAPASGGKKIEGSNISLNMLQQLQQLRPAAAPPRISQEQWVDAPSSSGGSFYSSKG